MQRERSVRGLSIVFLGLALLLGGCQEQASGLNLPGAKSPTLVEQAPLSQPPRPTEEVTPPARVPATAIASPSPVSLTAVGNVPTEEARVGRQASEPTPTPALPAAVDDVGPGVVVGDPAPDFSLLGLDGSPVRLSDFRGQTVVVNFFATWCGPCAEELPAFQSAYRQYGSQGVQVLLVDLKESPADVRAFAKRLKLTMPVVIDERGTVAAQQYQLTSLPTTVFIDRRGIVRGIQILALSTVLLGASIAWQRRTLCACGGFAARHAAPTAASG